MGNFVSAFLNKLVSKKEQRILLLGLDAAGKSTILYKFKLGETVHTIPTIGFNVEQVQYKNINFTMWDIGGQEKIRPLWRHYYNGVNAIIYVIDSNDQERIEEAKDELQKLLQEDQLRNSVLLVLANKQDLPNSMSIASITNELELYDMKNRSWFVQSCVATTGTGLYEGLDWLAAQLNK